MRFGSVARWLAAQLAVLVAVLGLAGSAWAASGIVAAWGNNGSGELGDGSTTNSSTPVRVEGVGGSGVAAVAAGSDYSLGLRSDGSAVAWGFNGNGELGDGTTTNSSAPVVVKGVGGSGVLSGAVGVAAGFAHSLAVRSDGSVVAGGTTGSWSLEMARPPTARRR